MAKDERNVVLTGVDIPFMDLVRLLVKLSLAAVPAGIILMIIWGAFWTVLGGFFRGCAVSMGGSGF